MEFIHPPFLRATFFPLFLEVVFHCECCLFHYSIVRLTSPNLNYYIVVGSVCLYVTIYIWIYPATSEIFTYVQCNVSLVCEAL